MQRDEFEPLISEWLVSILNCEVTTTENRSSVVNKGLELILNCKVTTSFPIQFGELELESILNCGTTSTHFSIFHHSAFVKSVLNDEMKTTTISNLII